MTKYDIRVRRSKMTSGRIQSHKDYGLLMQRHRKVKQRHRKVKRKRRIYLIAFATVIIFVIYLVLRGLV